MYQKQYKFRYLYRKLLLNEDTKESVVYIFKINDFEALLQHDSI